MTGKKLGCRQSSISRPIRHVFNMRVHEGALNDAISKLCAERMGSANVRNDLKGTGKRGHIVADTLLPTEMFLRLPTRATFVADTNFVSETQKCF